MEVSGTGANGTLLVGEALGADEVPVGLPFQGRAGQALDRMMQRGGLNRDDFKIANVLFCRPPNNKLAGESYAQDAIDYCSPNLDRCIADFQPRCIVALGVTAFRRLIPEFANQHGVGLLDSKKHKGARGYVFWSAKYKTWVLPTVHPSFVMRGKTAWAQVLIHDIQRGTEIARDGYEYIEGSYLLDPTPMAAMAWAVEFEQAWMADNSLFLSVDIETPQKGSDEEELDLEDGSDYIILRCGYSYMDYRGMSIPWGGPYHSIHEKLLSHPCDKLWWNGSYDIPRILASK
jgi:uracil-DNA glycosylase family 4